MTTSTIRGLDARMKLATSRTRRFTDQRLASELAHEAMNLARKVGDDDFHAGRFQLPCFFSGERLLAVSWIQAQDKAFLTYKPRIGDVRGLDVRVRLAQARILRLVDPSAGDTAEGETNSAAVDFGYHDENSNVPSLFADEPDLIAAWKYGRQAAVDRAIPSEPDDAPRHWDVYPSPGCDWRGGR